MLLAALSSLLVSIGYASSAEAGSCAGIPAAAPLVETDGLSGRLLIALPGSMDPD